MCSPEDDLPKNVLLSEFTEDEIGNISKKASKLFCDNLEELICDIEFKKSDLNMNIHKLVSSIDRLRWEFAQGILVKQLDSLYKLISNPKELVKELNNSMELYKFYQQITKLSEQIDLCLLKVLFEFTQVYEPLYIIPLSPSVVLSLYAKSCEIAMKFVDRDKRKKLEKCQAFFSDSSEWMKSRTNDWPSKMKKRYPNFEDNIKYVKRLIAREKKR